MKAKLSLVFLILLTSIACSDNDLKKVAEQMFTVSLAVSQVQSSTIEANKTGLLNQEDTRKILLVCQSINESGLKVDSVLRSIQKLDPESRQRLIVLLIPISQALDPTSLTFIEQIQDEKVRQGIKASFILMRTTISTIQIILATS